MPELTAAQRAELRAKAEADAVDPKDHTYWSYGKTVLALLADLDAAEADLAGRIEQMRIMDRQAEAFETTLDRADALATDVGKWHAFDQNMSVEPFDICVCGELDTYPVHSAALQAYEESRGLLS